jgi:hypothetical protein
MIAIDGKVYAPMGGGITSSTMSAEVVMTADRCVWAVRGFEERVVAAKDEIVAKAMARGIALGRPTHLKMIVREDGLAIAMTSDRRVHFELGRVT